jgi:hypothetical protein
VSGEILVGDSLTKALLPEEAVSRESNGCFDEPSYRKKKKKKKKVSIFL